MKQEITHSITNKCISSSIEMYNTFIIVILVFALYGSVEIIHSYSICIEWVINLISISHYGYIYTIVQNLHCHSLNHHSWKLLCAWNIKNMLLKSYQVDCHFQRSYVLVDERRRMLVLMIETENVLSVISCRRQFRVKYRHQWSMSYQQCKELWIFPWGALYPALL